MPSKSKKQARFMAAVANNPDFAKKAGVPQNVGQEFANADKRNKDMPSYFDSTKKKPGKAVKKGYARGGMAHDKKVLRNLDDEVYRIADKERMGGAEGRDARAERGRINREKDYEKRQLNKAEGGVVKKRRGGPLQKRGQPARLHDPEAPFRGRYARPGGKQGDLYRPTGGRDRYDTGGPVQTKKDKKDESLGSTKPRGWGNAARGWQGRYDATKRQR